jgi:hypothetical protein
VCQFSNVGTLLKKLAVKPLAPWGSLCLEVLNVKLADGEDRDLARRSAVVVISSLIGSTKMYQEED